MNFTGCYNEKYNKISAIEIRRLYGIRHLFKITGIFDYSEENRKSTHMKKPSYN